MGWLMWCYQLLCLQLVLLHSLSCANLCSHEQSSALLHFKQLFFFDEVASYNCDLHSYPKMMDWKEDTDCCSWDGITCDRVTGHVIGLDLSCSWLQGNIPSNTSLFLLSHLQKLNLAFNDFSLSQIPYDFVRFPSLKHLNLSSSYFSGQVPFQIIHLSKLISLDLSGNYDLTHETLVMKGLVQNMSQLQELSLGSVNMSTVALGTLTNINLPSLTYLSLADCELQGSFPEIFINLTQLHTLDLSSNRLSGPIPSGVGGLRNLASINLDENLLDGTIPSGLFSLPSLETISLSNNQLSGPIPSGLFRLSSLETISLQHNHLSGPIPSGLFSLPSLETISLQYNQLSGPIPSGLFSLPSLETISLAYNKLSGPIPSWLFSLPSLETISLEFNQLSGPIPSRLFSLPSLEYISLEYNRLSGPIPSSIFELVNLTYLDLSANHLSGMVELYMFAKLKKLQNLYLSRNSLSVSTTIKVNSSFPNLSYLGLSSCNINEFPKILSTVDNLLWLALSDNKIRGHIPNWLFNITTLSFLDLSNNFLTSIEQLPRSMGLQSLDLRSNLLQGLLPTPPPFLSSFLVSHNNMTGAIPSTFCNLSSLSYLDLSDNSLYGTIPQCLGNYTTISVLDLRMNNFHGSIPQTFSNGCQLKTMNLNGNQLEGSLPPSLVNCGNLKVLDVGNNKINDTFPHWLAGISQLQVLILRSNRFHGPLGNSRTRLPFSKLRILDLSHNGFTGPLRTRFFKNLQAMMSRKHNGAEMRYARHGGSYYDSTIVTMIGVDMERERILTIFTTIDLSSNKFQGLLPDPPPQLYFYSVSHNMLTGAIPSSFCNLSSLRYLDLSNNTLFGVIPQCLGNSTSIYVLDLKMNNFHGSIPQTFANGCQLTTLDLNSNRLAGSLPLSLANCGNLEVLDVGNNKINGTFPHWLATLPQLQVLILRSNRFYGALGDSTARLRFSMLRILDLSHNSFTGHLQKRFFRKFQAMMSGKNNSADTRYMGDGLYKDTIMVTMKGFEIEMQRVLTIFTAMDLSSNRFQGRILDVVGKLNSLIVLNFSHNNLIGHIPLSMGNLTEIESLDLSSNKLDGKIPQELTSLTFLSVLNLSYNHLMGPIPQGNQFHTFRDDSYFGNLGLCGLPMSETCSNDEPPDSQPTIFHEEHDNSSWFDWKIIMMGYGSGTVIGLSIGYIVFSTGKPWWFVSMVERKVIKLTERRRRRRRN